MANLDDAGGLNDEFPSPPEGDSLDKGDWAPGNAVDRSNAFDPGELNKRLEFTRIDEWRPGQRVCLLQRSAPLWVMLTLGLIAAGLSAVAGAYPLWSVAAFCVGPDSDARAITIALSTAGGGLWAAMLMFNHFRERELTLDWGRGLLALRRGSQVFQWTLSDVQQLVFAQTGAGAAAKGDPSDDVPPSCDCRLDLVLPGETVLVLKNERTANDAAGVGRAIETLGAELAAALGKSYSRTTLDPGRELRQAIRLSPAQKLPMVLLAITAAVLLAWGGIRERQFSQAAAQLRRLGVNVARMGSFTRNDDVICQNYWNLELTDGAALAAHGDEIRDLLAELPKLGLDAGESNLSDAELSVFRGSHLRLADVSQTAVTDAGIAMLAECDDLTYLDAYDAPIGDAALGALSRLPRLEFLYLPGTRVTDEGLKSLHGLRSLRVVHVGGCRVTPAGVAALRAALPGAKVTP